MIKQDVEIGGVYLAKVSNNVAKVRIEETSPNGGWYALNLDTKRKIRIRTAARLTQINRGGPWMFPTLLNKEIT